MSTLGDIVSKSAPLVGSVLNSFLPGSGLIVSGLAALFGANPQSEADIAAKINADADSALKLREFELEHQNDLAKIIATDRASARQMNVDTTKALGKTDWMMHFLAMSVTIAALGYPLLSNILHYTLDKGIFHDMLNLDMPVLMFYFGGMYMQARQATSYPAVDIPPPAKTR